MKPNFINFKALVAGLSDGRPRHRRAVFEKLWLAGTREGKRVLAKILKDPVLRRLADRDDPYDAVGVAVEPRRFRDIKAKWKVRRESPVPPARQAREFCLERSGRRLDILTPKGGGPLRRFLRKQGERIQQVEIFVRDVRAVLNRFKALANPGVVLPFSRPVRGAGGTRVGFGLFKLGKRRLLVEFVEKT